MKTTFFDGSLHISPETAFERGWFESFVYKHPYIQYRENGNTYENLEPELTIVPLPTYPNEYTQDSTLEDLFEQYINWAERFDKEWESDQKYTGLEGNINKRYGEQINHLQRQINKLEEERLSKIEEFRKMVRGESDDGEVED